MGGNGDLSSFLVLGMRGEACLCLRFSACSGQAFPCRGVKNGPHCEHAAAHLEALEGRQPRQAHVSYPRPPRWLASCSAVCGPRSPRGLLVTGWALVQFLSLGTFFRSGGSSS